MGCVKAYWLWLSCGALVAYQSHCTMHLSHLPVTPHALVACKKSGQHQKLPFYKCCCAKSAFAVLSCCRAC